MSAPIAGVHVSARRTHLDAAKPDTSGEIMHIGEVGRFVAGSAGARRGWQVRGGRTPQGVTARVPQWLLALTAAIWRDHATGRPTLRSLTANDH